MKHKKQLDVILAPALSDEKLPEKTVAFVQVWMAMVDLKRYSAQVIIDLENVYFLLYDLKSGELEDCYLGYLKKGCWRLELDKKVTWDKIKAVSTLLSSNETFDIEGRW